MMIHVLCSLYGLKEFWDVLSSEWHYTHHAENQMRSVLYYTVAADRTEGAPALQQEKECDSGTWTENSVTILYYLTGNLAVVSGYNLSTLFNWGKQQEFAYSKNEGKSVLTRASIVSSFHKRHNTRSFWRQVRLLRLHARKPGHGMVERYTTATIFMLQIL